MKTVEMAEATASLSEYARKARKETLIVTRRGKPVAALMPVDARTDLENLVVTTHPTFRAIVERSEARYKGRADSRRARCGPVSPPGARRGGRPDSPRAEAKRPVAVPRCNPGAPQPK